MINIVVATRGKRQDCLTYQSIRKWVDSFAERHKDTQKTSTPLSIIETYYENNTESLAHVYNDALLNAQKYSKDIVDYLLFVHDDVTFRTNIAYGDLEDTLKEQNYDISGLAGTIAAQIKKPALWHLMSTRDDYRGAVAHPAREDTYFVTSFGPMPSRVLLIDGLFMAVKVSCIDDNIRFDESNPGKWHHYDLDFCLTCNYSKRTIGVVDVPVLHQSPGLLSTEDPGFKLSQTWFVEKWAGGNK